jgi:hypothetical protein
VDFDMVLIQPKIPCGLKINPMFRLVGKTFIDIPFKFHTLIIHILNKLSSYIAILYAFCSMPATGRRFAFLRFWI